GEHEQHRAHNCRLAQRRLRATRPKGGLAAHAAESRGDVARLAALQQDDGDQKKADQNVQQGNEKTHATLSSMLLNLRNLVRKAGLEPACLAAPPPQDGVSASFTTSALTAHYSSFHRFGGSSRSRYRLRPRLYQSRKRLRGFHARGPQRGCAARPAFGRPGLGSPGPRPGLRFQAFRRLEPLPTSPPPVPEPQTTPGLSWARAPARLRRAPL